ncbi:BA75_02821T0 [Komagataella pastoris]|uniref:Cytochrome c oxidase subunit 13, mitochondrial n=1 Tax=Komagataella pastoris TaxID=4922 RepID=A0A1B2JB60_PICPA|nr:BA75_02821T0 [Komagataella pastoris]
MFRTAASSIGRRGFTTVKGDPAKAQAFKKHLDDVYHHSKGTTALWKKISYFIALPAIALTAVNTYFVEAEHAEHRAHNRHLSDEEWPKAYPYQNVRRVDFFWGDGDKTLFWNPDVNRHVKE